jgi:N-acyl-D-amino-acid deacylase
VFITGVVQAQEIDILIRNGRILDGTGNPDFRADVAIRGDEIVAVGKLGETPAKRVIDAEGLFVVPGFIDVHSHADRGLASDDVEERRAQKNGDSHHFLGFL